MNVEVELKVELDDPFDDRLFDFFSQRRRSLSLTVLGEAYALRLRNRGGR